MSLPDVLETFRQDVTAFAASGVVHRSEGTAIASVHDGDVDAEAADAYLAEMAKQHEAAQSALGVASSTEDIIIETTHGTAVARLLPDTDYVWTLLAGPGANTALLRAIMRKHHDKVMGALP